MPTDDNGSSYVSETTRKRRYYRRTERPAAWWPWGLLPLLGLFLLFLWGALRTAPHMQNDVETEVASALASVGVDVDRVTADGQNVTVRASRAPVDIAFVRAVAQATACETWVGELDCPLEVSVDVATTGPSQAEMEPEPAPPVSPEPVVAATPAPRHHDFRFNVTGRAVRLTGEVASLDERMRIVNQAKASFEEVDDQLSVSSDTATGEEPLAADRALDVLAGFERGEARWLDGVLTARGRVPATADADAVRATFLATFPAESAQPALGEIDIQVTQVVDRCNRNLAAALANSTIRFRSASAQIDAGNDALLVSLAELIEACPGTLTIEGHTDSIGDADMNEALSQARADAVREALVALGVPQDRLSARGYGESRPIGDNGTRAGRAQNRRIVIAIDDL